MTEQPKKICIFMHKIASEWYLIYIKMAKVRESGICLYMGYNSHNLTF